MTTLADLEPSCKDCKCWEGDEEPDDDGFRYGFCRYGPGTPVLTDGEQVVTILPIKRDDEWCSFLKPRN